MRVVFDTNIILSALLWGGPPAEALNLSKAQQVTILSTEALFKELVRVVMRPKFQPKFVAIGRSPMEALTEYAGAIEAVVPAEIPIDAVRDPNDRMILACAVGGKADRIVSGDKDLLVLGVYQN